MDRSGDPDVALSYVEGDIVTQWVHDPGSIKQDTLDGLIFTKLRNAVGRAAKRLWKAQVRQRKNVDNRGQTWAIENGVAEVVDSESADAPFRELEMGWVIAAAVCAMDPPRDEIVYLSKFEGLSRAQIAEALGLTANVVRYNLAKGGQQLEKVINAYRASEDLPEKVTALMRQFREEWT